MDLAHHFLMASIDLEGGADAPLAMVSGAAVALTAHIAEGATRVSAREFMRFLYEGISCTAEMETLLLIGERIKAPWFTPSILEETGLIRKMLYGLIASLRKSTVKDAEKVAEKAA